MKPPMSASLVRDTDSTEVPAPDGRKRDGQPATPGARAWNSATVISSRRPRRCRPTHRPAGPEQCRPPRGAAVRRDRVASSNCPHPPVRRQQCPIRPDQGHAAAGHPQRPIDAGYDVAAVRNGTEDGSLSESARAIPVNVIARYAWAGRPGIVTVRLPRCVVRGARSSLFGEYAEIGLRFPVHGEYLDSGGAHTYLF
jgi:hypothetical protein